MEVQHIDFQRVDTTRKIHVKVPLHFINEDVAPGVKLASGIVTHIMTDLDVSCLAAACLSLLRWIWRTCRPVIRCTCPS